MRNYEPHAGESISHATEVACKMATDGNEPVEIVFNKVKLFVRPGANPDHICEIYSRECDERAEQYRNSDEGRAADARREAEVVAKQAAVDALLVTRSFSSLRSTVEWFDKLTPLADDVRVRLPTEQLVAELEAVGYESNACCDLPKERYTESKVMGVYIVGQVLSCMKKGMPPHPVTNKFAKEYLAMESKA